MARLSKAKVSPQAEKDGVWVTFFEDIRVRLRHRSHPLVQQALVKAGVDRQLARGIDADIGEALKEPFANALVTDWQNMLDDDDQPIPFSPEVCLELWRDPANRPFWEFCLQESARDDLYRAEAIADVAGN